jgi:high-affinity nickel-transport protein
MRSGRVQRSLRPFSLSGSSVGSKLLGLYAILIPANIAAWVAAWIAFSDRPLLLGTALLAYVFGLRHAVDADHVAAIDNVVRKLMQDGRKPMAVGLFFSLGHSTIVVAAVVVIAVTTATFQANLEAFQRIGGLIGTMTSAVFLLAIGIANLFVLKGTWAGLQRIRRGERLVEEDLNQLLSGHGIIARLVRPVFRMVSRSWHMYPLGLLFGLGFDTATEIGLLAISATQAAQGMPIWAILVFPALFTAGMALVDTTDSALMVGAYGWAFVKPVRKLWYNMTITAASVAVALFIGGVQSLALISSKLDLTGGLWDVVGALSGSLANLGFVMVGIFVGAWVVSAAIYRLNGYEKPITADHPE